ncbi:MAG: hypothetical protein ACPF9E_12570 [Alteromonas oceani]
MIKKWVKSLPDQERAGVTTLLVFCAIVVLIALGLTVFDILRQAL